MDSHLLAGAYSNRYKYIERCHIDNLKSEHDLEKFDVQEKARRLSQETNKRRKLLAQKQKKEADREEKRRQEILNRRHNEQKQATEKYQRSHISNRQHLHSSHSRYHHSKLHGPTIDEALHLVRGSQSLGENLQKVHQHYGTGDPLEYSYIKNAQHHERNENAGHSSNFHTNNRPQSGPSRSVDATKHAELMERSLRNFTSSRSRFEQQLEQHQQLLIQQQQKSMQSFNQAVRQEIDMDHKVQRMEDHEEDEDMLRTDESLSSLDSLEEDPSSNRHTRTEVGKQELVASYQEASSGHGIRNNGQENARRGQNEKIDEQSNNKQQNLNVLQSNVNPTRPLVNIAGNSPPGYHNDSGNSQTSGNLVVLGNHLQVSSNMQQPAAERQLMIGTALRLPQQTPSSVAVIKQPPPSLQYNSQLLAYRRFEPRGSYLGSVLHSDANSQEMKHNSTASTQMNTNYTTENPKKTPPHTEPSPFDYSELQRPKAHIYAWTSPPPVEGEQEQHAVVSKHGNGQNMEFSSFDPNVAVDRVIASNIHLQTSHAIATSATVTWTNSPASIVFSKEVVENQPSTNSFFHHSPTFTTPILHTEDQKYGSVGGSVPTQNSSVPPKVGIREPPHNMANASKLLNNASTTGNLNLQDQGVSTVEGTLGLVNGKLTVVNNVAVSELVKEKTVTFSGDNSETQKEVKGILKRPPDIKPDAPQNVQTRFEVQDSIEIAKKHIYPSGQGKTKLTQKKKAVRFADVHYEQSIFEDSDSENSVAVVNGTNTVQSAPQIKTLEAQSGKIQEKVRPASAKVASKSSEDGIKVARFVSAGTARYTSANRPKAAAHIIMSGDASSNATEGVTPGLTVHKSQLEKKVTLVNTNFMSRTPSYSGTTPISTAGNSTILLNTTSIPLNSTAMTYVALQTKSGVPVASNVDGIQKNGFNKTVPGSFGIIHNDNDIPKISAGTKTHHSTILPSHSLFSNTNINSTPKTVYNENGLRIDRTPTDEEINSLWTNMRSMLEKGGEKGNTMASATAAASPAATNATNSHHKDGDLPTNVRQTVQLSHKYIDGAALGIPNGMNRTTPSYAYQKSGTTNGASNGNQKLGGHLRNGYLQRYTLLQQRHNANANIPPKAAHTNGYAEQTVRTMGGRNGTSTDQHAAVTNSALPPSYVAREEITESMAGFMAAEQLLQTHGPQISDSRVFAAIESAQVQQEMYNSIRQKLAKGGPSTLSMEEHRLLESLDRLNERLKVLENRAPNGMDSHDQTEYANVSASGIRGHSVTTSQWRNTSGRSPMNRPVSGRLLTRQHY